MHILQIQKGSRDVGMKEIVEESRGKGIKGRKPYNMDKHLGGNTYANKRV